MCSNVQVQIRTNLEHASAPSECTPHVDARLLLRSPPQTAHLDFVVYIRPRWRPKRVASKCSTAPCFALPRIFLTLVNYPRVASLCGCLIRVNHGGTNFVVRVLDLRKEREESAGGYRQPSICMLLRNGAYHRASTCWNAQIVPIAYEWPGAYFPIAAQPTSATACHLHLAYVWFG